VHLPNDAAPRPFYAPDQPTNRCATSIMPTPLFAAASGAAPMLLVP
jgi:hypothetical protein